MHTMVRRGLAAGAACLLSVSVFGVQQAVARGEARATGKPGVVSVDEGCVARNSLVARLGEPSLVRGRWVVDSVTVTGDFSACSDAQTVAVRALGGQDVPLAGGQGLVSTLNPNAGVTIKFDRAVDGENLSALNVTVRR